MMASPVRQNLSSRRSDSRGMRWRSCHAAGGRPHVASRHRCLGVPASSDPRAAIFLEKGCPQCHSISALGVKSPAEIGPDLTIAYTDVQSRFNMELEEFLKNPTGTMQMVLSSQIKLSPAGAGLRDPRSSRTCMRSPRTSETRRTIDMP